MTNKGEGRPNQIGSGRGHARERHIQASAQIYVNSFPNNHPEQTKSAFFTMEDQDIAARSAINSASGQAAFRRLDTNPAIVREAINATSSVNNVVIVKGPNASGNPRNPVQVSRRNVLFLIERTPAHQLHVVTCYPKN